MDPYQVLGVARTASQDEIKNAYRALAKKHHPDLNPSNQAAEKRFKDVAQAYERIGTPEARQKFERGEQEEARQREWQQQRGPFYRSTQEPGGGASGRYGFQFDDDVFESIFGGARRRQGPPEEVYRLEIDLRDAVHGGERELGLPTGKRLRMRIPPGVTDGARLRSAEQGVTLEIHVREDPRFRREGDDLIREQPVSIADAVFGGEVRVPTLDGEALLKVPPRSNTGRKLRLAGKGVFDRRTGKRGDELVVLKVMLPETIDPELEAALRSWQDRQKGARGAAA